MSKSIKINLVRVPNSFTLFKSKYGVEELPLINELDEYRICLFNNAIYVSYRGEWRKILEINPSAFLVNIINDTETFSIFSVIDGLCSRYTLTRCAEEGNVAIFASNTVLVFINGVWKKVASFSISDGDIVLPTPPSSEPDVEKPGEGDTTPSFSKEEIFEFISEYIGSNNLSTITIPQCIEISQDITNILEEISKNFD